jgi:hypothetical protein
MEFLLESDNTYNDKRKNNCKCLCPADCPCRDAKHDEGTHALDKVRDQSDNSERMVVKTRHFSCRPISYSFFNFKI